MGLDRLLPSHLQIWEIANLNLTFDLNVILNLNLSNITRVSCWSERREWDRARAYMHSGLLLPCALTNSTYAEVVAFKQFYMS